MHLYPTIFLILFSIQVLANKTPTEAKEKASNSTLTNTTTNSTSSLKKTSTIPLSSSTPSDSKTKITSEAGSSPVSIHYGREHVIGPTVTNNIANEKKKNGNTTRNKSHEDIKPVQDVTLSHEIIVPPVHDHQKPSVPKKGVSFPEVNPPFVQPSSNPSNTVSKNVSLVPNQNNSTQNHTTTPKKPLVTESDADYLDGAGVKGGNESDVKIDQIDPLLEHKNNSTDYVIPIVAIILSVPLVAILISMVYKRSADWWQHRNYKRMDFLIEGIYHN